MPVLIVPGYGMNSFIFGYHPRGRSFEAALVNAGLETWRVDLRAQGPSKSVGGGQVYGLADLAKTDLGAAIDCVLERTVTSRTSVAVIGASLGGSIMFAHAALVPEHRIGAMVAIGAPVRWVRAHPLVRAAFVSPGLVGMLPLRGTRAFAKTFMPALLRHMPWVLSMYLNREHVDLDSVDELTKTIEDPNRHINREIAAWVGRKDLLLGTTNVTHALRSIAVPLLTVVANADGIVPRETAEYAHHHVASRERMLLQVGSPTLRLAHADMFLSDHAEELVYRPIREWIAER
jgi:pimeloyl-ACP methyl ester carboxylesterase